MKKTCYFCKRLYVPDEEYICEYSGDPTEPGILACNLFLKNNDWLEYEHLLNVKQLAKDMIIPIKLLQEQSDSGFHVISVEGQQKMIDQSETSHDKLLEIFEKERR